MSRWLIIVSMAIVVDNRVDGNRRLTDLAVADNQLTLSAADGHHRVDGLDTGLQGLLYRLTEDYTRSLALEGQSDKVALNGTCAIDRFTQRIDNSTEQSFAHGQRGNFAGAAGGHVLGNLVDVIEQDDTHIALFQVHGHTVYAVFKLDQFAGTHIVEPVHVSHTITNFENSTYFFKIDFGVDLVELFL